MLHNVLKAKIHKATITEANLNYEGSCTIDTELLEKCKMSVNEQVQIVNINNGERFMTYIIPGKKGSGTICLNGACARLAQIGDKVIIMTYGIVDDESLKDHKPTIFIVDDQNKILSAR